MFSWNMFPQNVMYVNIIFLAMQTLREILMDTYIYICVNKNAQKIEETVNFQRSLLLMCFPGTSRLFPCTADIKWYLMCSHTNSVLA